VRRERLEVQDIFRACGPAWRRRQAGHLSLDQLKVMAAIERCRTAALGGHVAACEDCGHIHVAYNSCRNRHCPKCQGAAAKDWLAARQAELLPVPYYHVVFTLPAAIARIAYQNKARVYGILFRAASETLLTIAADPKHLGANIGITAVLHTWGSAMTHHPHLHCIVPGGGLSPDGNQWICCRPGFFLPVRVLSRLFRRLFLEKLEASLDKGDLTFRNELAPLAEPNAFAALLGPLRNTEWVVYAKRPFAGPETVLAYLSRYTHRVAISNSRLIAFDGQTVTFTWKDYRAKARDRQKLMTLDAAEFIRRFLLHVLPKGFHRIRHYGLFANGGRTENLARARQLLDIEATQDAENPGNQENEAHDRGPPQPCPACGGPMILIDTFGPGQHPHRPRPRAPPTAEALAA
jgi:predicted Zn-ribbon and HTH transcriptional regulator